MANVALEKLAANPIEKEKMFYTGKVEGARFFINRITVLVPAKLETLNVDEVSCCRIPEDAFAV
jgi:hypothetical protein